MDNNDIVLIKNHEVLTLLDGREVAQRDVEDGRALRASREV